MLNGTPLWLKNEVERGESLINKSDGFCVIVGEMCSRLFCFLTHLHMIGAMPFV